MELLIRRTDTFDQYVSTNCLNAMGEDGDGSHAGLLHFAPSARGVRLVVLVRIFILKVLVGEKHRQRLTITAKTYNIFVDFDARGTVKPVVEMAGAFLLPGLVNIRRMDIE